MAVDRSKLMDGAVSRFQVGECLSLGFNVWAKNLVAFAAVTALVHVPLVIYTVLLLAKGPPDQALDADAHTAAWRTWQIVVPLGSLVLSLIATGAVTYGVVQQLRGQPASLGSCISVGLARLPAVFVVGLLVGLCVVVGLFLLIVPGLIFLCMLWVSVPVTVIEQPGITASLGRSSQLTKGARGPIFLVLLVLGVINWIVNFLVTAVFLSTPTWEALPTFLIVQFLVGVVAMGSLQATVNAVGYWLLRSSREGATIEDLARVFA
jgi:hypothetical protein